MTQAPMTVAAAETAAESPATCPATSAVILVYVSAPPAAAERLAQTLVGRRLAACVQIVPDVRSIYSWRGGVERAQEVQLQIKTTQDRYAAVETAVREQHPYELPEILAVTISAGLPAYLQWIRDETQ